MGLNLSPSGKAGIKQRQHPGTAKGSSGLCLPVLRVAQGVVSAGVGILPAGLPSHLSPAEKGTLAGAGVDEGGDAQYKCSLSRTTRAQMRCPLQSCSIPSRS